MAKEWPYCKNWRHRIQLPPFAIKLGISVFSLLLAFKLLFLQGFPFSSAPFDSVHHTRKAISRQGNVSQSIGETGVQKCDLFVGDWIPKMEEPFYNMSCSFVEGHQNCAKNGRADTGFLYWRWKPHRCELPRLHPARFLDLMRGKSLALIGDSISKNHAQSLLCMLSSVEKAIQVYHDDTYRSRRWHFPVHNFTLSVIWSPFLARADIFEDANGVSTSEVELHLDILDTNWTSQYDHIDYLMFSGSKWFGKPAMYYENNTILGCHYCPKRNLTELGIDIPYRKVIKNVFNYIVESKRKGMIFFRTSTPNHFEGGEWFNGGACRRTKPAKEGEFEFDELDRILRNVEMEEFKKASGRALEGGVNLRLFDVGPLSLLRPDGHPGPYRFYRPFGESGSGEKVVNDCLHWCLPGPIDSWNDLLMEMLVKG